MLYISELCEDCAVANEIDYEIDDPETSIHGIHDNGPRDHCVWRLTLTAYRTGDISSLKFLQLISVSVKYDVITKSVYHASLATNAC